MEDKRKKRRNSCFLRGEISIINIKDKISVEVHDISDNGMRLILEYAVDVPDEFILIVPRRSLKEKVCVVRRLEKELAVKIIPSTLSYNSEQ